MVNSVKVIQPAVRVGLNNIKGLEQEAAWRIEEARAI
jgi:error-prone DNA polymerase